MATCSSAAILARYSIDTYATDRGRSLCRSNNNLSAIKRFYNLIFHIGTSTTSASISSRTGATTTIRPAAHNAYLAVDRLLNT